MPQHDTTPSYTWLLVQTYCSLVVIVCVGLLSVVDIAAVSVRRILDVVAVDLDIVLVEMVVMVTVVYWCCWVCHRGCD